METRKPHPSDVIDEEWAFVVPYLTLLPLDAEQWTHHCTGRPRRNLPPGLASSASLQDVSEASH